MQRRFSTLITFFFIPLILCSCSSLSNKNWTALIPEDASFVIVPQENLSLAQVPSKDYASLLDDLTPVAIQQIAALDSVVSEQLRIKALVLYPSTSSESNLVWITENPSQDIEQWVYRFYQPFTQNNYWFNDIKIHKLFFNKDNIFAAQAGSWLVLSESSLALENALRSYTSQKPPLDAHIKEGEQTLVVNVPGLDHWLKQFGSVSYRPSIKNVFDGASPVSFSFGGYTDSLQNNISLNGTMALEADSHSVLIDALTFKNKPLSLDRYIGSNAAAFALMRLPPVSIPIEPESPVTQLDSLLITNLDLYQRLAGYLDDEFAFEAFPESGLSAGGEHLIIRKLAQPNAFAQALNVLVQDSVISQLGSTYQINSSVFSALIGSELSTLRNFYLDISGDVAVIARRKGLAESVESDRTRRRVIYYDDTYSPVRSSLPSSLSGFVWAESDALLPFLKPFLKTDNVAGGLLNRFDITAIHFGKNQENIDISINTFSKKGSLLPYEELWVMPLVNNNLSGPPILGDIVGSSADEVIFSTQDGKVMALAVDGTIVMQTSTDGLKPIGSPVFYDWYGSGQPVILLPAGNKIFAWNETGTLLPSFPIELDEQISSPLLVTDVQRNGIPEIVIATQDRKVHALDGRGDNIRGWPKNTNAVVESTPVYTLVDDVWSVWAYSQNALHSWLRDGSPRPGYPQFINARFSGSPIVYEDQVLGSAADGHLYSIGQDPLFSDSLGTYLSQDDISVKSLYVTNNELSKTIIKENVLLADSTDFYREDLITTQSLNGSLFLYNKDGKLRFTQSMGQPVSNTFTPSIVDINSDDNMELVALADFGRLYAWEILTEERLYGLPTSGMKYPLITDINGDGQKELIAQTREGLRCWTINREE
ncbi:MAG: hypothetical protein FH748_02635 [Balneolaceae bacterium]|nr:hypothetical protein [Balneolaceae bacterium]